MSEQKEEFNLNELLTPQWIKEIDPDIAAVANDHRKLASVIGTMLGLLDYCRSNMPAADWTYVEKSLREKLKETASEVQG